MDGTEAHATDTSASESSEKQPQNSGAMVGIPVMVVIQVPVSVPVPDSLRGEAVCEVNGDVVVDGEQHEEELVKAMNMAMESPLVDGAANALLAAAFRFKHENPGHGIKVLHTPMAGVIDEQEIK